VNPVSGEMLAIAPGTAIVSATIDGKVAQLTVAVTKAPILLNEVRPDGDATGGWVELFNPTELDIDVSGWTLTAGDVFQALTLRAGTTIRARDYLAIDETTIPSGLKARDAVHVFSRFGVQVNSFAWTEDAPTSYGRCPDGAGAFVITVEDTKGFANGCEPPGGSLVRLWSVYPEWGWGTDDSERALSSLKRFGSVSVLNGHMHQASVDSIRE
jgi:hypothetical protein